MYGCTCVCVLEEEEEEEEAAESTQSRRDVVVGDGGWGRMRRI